MTTELNSEIATTNAIVELLEKLPTPALPGTASTLARLARSGLDVAERVQAIEDDETYELIVRRGRELNTIVASLEADRVAITKPLLDRKRQWDAVFSGAIAHGEKAVAIYRRLCGDYQARVERRRREAEEAAARATAEAEAKRQKELEDQKRQAEAEAAAALQKGDVEGALDAAAEVDKARADAAAPIRAHVPAAYVPPAPRVSGSAKRKRWVWDWRPGGLRELVYAAVERARNGDDSLLALVQADPVLISKRVGALGEHTNIPGIEVREETSVAFGRK